jgi:hypothetical protein
MSRRFYYLTVIPSSPTQLHTGECGNVYIRPSDNTTDKYYILPGIISVGLECGISKELFHNVNV